MKKKHIYLIIGIITLLVILAGGTYAYFSINTSASTNGANVTGSAKDLGTPTIKTVTSNLYLNLNASLMSQDNAGTTYFANSDTSGTALTENPNYTLAEVSLTNGTGALDCTYNFKVTATVTKSITDSSDSDVLVQIGDQTISLKNITDAGTNGVIVTGKVKNLTTGNNKLVSLSSSVLNTSNTQDDLVDNSYTINIEPYSSGDVKAFSCVLHTTLVDKLIADNTLWQSNLDGDGYRFTGTSVNNFACFGTNDLTTCTSNPSTYMYRIVGIFPDSDGNKHIKLIKYKQLTGSYAWNTTKSDADWGTSSLYTGLNGSFFLTNTTYSYLQNSSWLSKIVDWKWTAVNTLSNEKNGPSYVNDLSPKNLYLHEMNKTGKTSSIGEWTTPTGKIGVMYASDFALSLGATSLNMTTGTDANRNTFTTSWIYQDNNDITQSSDEWLMARTGRISTYYYAWYIHAGTISNGDINSTLGIRPVFYLEEDITGTGTGTETDPYMLS